MLFSVPAENVKVLLTTSDILNKQMSRSKLDAEDLKHKEFTKCIAKGRKTSAEYLGSYYPDAQHKVMRLPVVGQCAKHKNALLTD